MRRVRCIVRIGGHVHDDPFTGIGYIARGDSLHKRAKFRQQLFLVRRRSIFFFDSYGLQSAPPGILPAGLL